MRATVTFSRVMDGPDAGRHTWIFHINGRPMAKDASPHGYTRRRQAVRAFQRVYMRLYRHQYAVKGLD